MSRYEKGFYSILSMDAVAGQRNTWPFDPTYARLVSWTIFWKNLIGKFIVSAAWQQSMKAPAADSITFTTIESNVAVDVAARTHILITLPSP